MSKFQNGLLLLRNEKNVYALLKQAGQLIEKHLYVDFLKTIETASISSETSISHADYFRLLNKIYSRPSTVCNHLELHVLLPPSIESGTNANNQNISSTHFKNAVHSCQISSVSVENVESNSGDKPEAKDSNVSGTTSRNKRSPIHQIDVCLLPLPNLSTDTLNDIQSTFDRTNLAFEYLSSSTNDSEDEKFDSRIDKFECKQTYPGVVIGGTFDRCHEGHKLLISTALLLAEKKITVGVADGVLLEKKILKELIDPIDIRISNVVNMINDYKPGLQHKVVPITDPCGPSGTDDDLQLLVVSEETTKGGDVVNNKRRENNLLPLDVFSINLVGDAPTDLSDSFKDEGKLSSSAKRVRELGTLRKAPNVQSDPHRNCYVIGVTGGIASGKSSVVKRLEKLGAYTIDCDFLGHETYKPGMPAYVKIVREFGSEVVNPEDKTINRKRLGPIVFSDPLKLKLLNSIVWPEIHRMKMEIITEISREKKHKVVIFEGAVLFEAGWESEADEVWCCVIPKQEAVRRIIERNGLPSDQAAKRVESQMTNEERVKRSNVILSTFWEREFTQKQCERAWKLLMDRLN